VPAHSTRASSASLSRALRRTARTLRLIAVVPALGVAVAAAVAQPAQAARDIPVAAANINDQNLKNANWRYGVRFVLDTDTRVHRFFTGFKALGAGGVFADQGTGGYGKGDAGVMNAQLVTVRADGTPDLGNVLAQETVTAQQRYTEIKSNYGISTVSGQTYFNFGGVALKANTMYVVVIRNSTSDPARNYFSINSPDMKESEAGPNGYNNLDPNKPGAVGGLDPREAATWSTDNGTNWVWGRLVGQGYYTGSATTDDGTRLPFYGWTATAGNVKPSSNQPYNNYWQKCTACTLTLRSAPRAVTLTQAGGYAAVGANVGVVTVKNLRTGQTGQTASIGSGLKRSALSPQVRIEAGDTYTITNTGTVFKNPADNFMRVLFRIGDPTGPYPFTTNTANTADRAELFATPHPWFPGSSSTPPPPVPTPTPTPTPPPGTAAPVARAVISPSAPVTGSPVTMDGSSSTGTAITCSWDLDGATTLTGCVTQFTFRYTGTKHVTLTVRDSSGRTSSVARDITLGAPGATPTPPPTPTPTPTPAPTGYADTIMQTAGLTHYWRLGESSGTSAIAAKGPAPGTYSAVTLGQVGLLTGDANRAVTFNGSTSNIRFGDVNDFAGTARFSVEAWVKPATVDSPSRRIFSKEASGTNGWLLWSNSSRLWFGRLRNGVYETVSTSPLTAGRRAHIVVSYDGGSLRMYRDGALAATAASTQALPDTSGPLTVGASSLGFGSFAGAIDEPAVYGGTVLTPTQIQQHFRIGSGA